MNYAEYLRDNPTSPQPNPTEANNFFSNTRECDLCKKVLGSSLLQLVTVNGNPQMTCSECRAKTCRDCGFIDDTVEFFYGTALCKDCQDNYINCERCDAFIHVDDAKTDYEDSTVCEDCFDKYSVECYNCSKIVAENDARYGCDDNGYCSDCFYDRFSICDTCNETIWQDDCNYTDDGNYCNYCYQEQGGNLLQYHSEEGRSFKGKKSKCLFGVEIEKEDESIRESIIARDFLESTGWAVEEDGSLDSQTGFEAISPILPLDRKYEKSLKQLAGNFAIAWIDTKEKNTLYLVREGNPCYIAETKDGWYFSSTSYSLEAVLLDEIKKEVYALKEGVVYKFNSKGIVDMSKVVFEAPVSRLGWGNYNFDNSSLTSNATTLSDAAFKESLQESLDDNGWQSCLSGECVECQLQENLYISPYYDNAVVCLDCLIANGYV